MATEKIYEVIRKLLALGTSPNENEAKSAMLKAHELMVKHKLTMRDLGDVKDKNITRKVFKDIKWTTDSGEIWITDICKAISPFYCCGTLWNTPRGTRTHYAQISGFEEDVQVCAAVLKYAIGFVRNRMRVETRKRPLCDPKDVAQSYAEGFAVGVKKALQKQTDDNPEWGLVAVTPKEVIDILENAGYKTVRTGQRSHVQGAYENGYEDGTKFDPSTKLGGN